MRIGSCLLMLADKRDMLAANAVPLVKRAGYDYAEVPLARLLPLSDADIRAYNELFVQNGLPVEAFNNSIPAGLAMVGPAVNRTVLREYVERAIKLSEWMGVSVITMCGPIRDWAPAGFSWDEGLAQYVDFMRLYAEKAEEAGITLAIEPINSEENGFIATLGDALRVIEACGAKNLKIVVDFYHFFKQNDDWEQLLRVCGEQVAHVHYATRVERLYPLEKDAAACRAILDPVLATGYTGRISIEGRTNDPEKDLPAACALFRELYS